MAKEKEFENILNECLDRLIKGEDINSCLARYPEYAAELGPLLKTALEARLAATLQPRPEFRQRAANEFQSAIRNLPAKQPRGAFRWQLRWVIPVAVVFVVLVGGSGTVVAATNAMPDSPLYGVKKAVESVQMAFTFSEEGKAELYAKFVDYRVEEIVKMAEEGKDDRVEQATQHMNGQLIAMATLELNVSNQAEKAGTFSLMMANEGAQSPSITVPAPTVAPTTTAAPTTTTTVPSPPRIATPESESNAVKDSGELNDIERLRHKLTVDFEKNLKKLQQQLEKAPKALKPVLQKAIDDLIAGYEQAIANLG